MLVPTFHILIIYEVKHCIFILSFVDIPILKAYYAEST